MLLLDPKRHGGSISARSDGPGKGSEFEIRLPHAPSVQRTDGRSPLEVSRTPPVPEPPAGARRVLVVDDNEDAAEMLCELVGSKGYQARVAYDGPSALRLAETFAPDIAFLDIGLPVMDGYELACRLREMPGLTSIRLIAVTGYGQESDRQKSRQAGFDHHLVKPVDLTDVETVLRRDRDFLAILHLVPYQIECPSCRRPGWSGSSTSSRAVPPLARSIAALASTNGRSVSWRHRQPERPPLPKPRTRSYGPKRKN